MYIHTIETERERTKKGEGLEQANRIPHGSQLSLQQEPLGMGRLLDSSPLDFPPRVKGSQKCQEGSPGLGPWLSVLFPALPGLQLRILTVLAAGRAAAARDAAEASSRQ